MSGCREWRSLPRCDLLPDAELTVWIAACPIDQVALTVDGTSLAPKSAARIQGGARVVTLPKLGQLEVRCGRSAPFRLALGAATSDPRVDAIAKLRRSGDLAGAETKARALSKETPDLLGLAGQRARNALAAGRSDEAVAAFEQAIAEDVANDLRGAEVRDRTALVHLHLTSHHPHASAEAQLTPLEPLAKVWADAAADLDYSWTAVALVFRDTRSLVPRARALIARAERLGLDESALDAHQMLLGAMTFVGRWPEVQREIAELRAALAKPWPSCKQAELWSNIGWHVLIGRREAPALFTEAPDEALARAAELYETSCDRPALHANAELNLGWAALFANDANRAAEHLAKAKRALPSPELDGELNRTHLDAEILLASGKMRDAKRTFARLGTLARTAGVLAAEWHAWFGEGRSCEAAHDLDGAVRAYEEAERVLATLARRVPFGEGRDRLLFVRGESAEHLVGALVRARRWPEAMSAIRRSRLGTLTFARQLEELRSGAPDERRRALITQVAAARAELDEAAAHAWSLPADAAEDAKRADEARRDGARRALDELLDDAAGAPRTLPALELPRGEAAVLAHAVDGGIAVIAVLDGEIAGEIVPRPSAGAPELAATARLLAKAKRAHVYTHPSLELLDWPLVQVSGRPLIERAPLVFHADLGAPKTSTVAAPRSALVVGDPVEALPRAREESEALARTLESAGWTVEVATGRALDRAAIVSLFAKPRARFHYSGHGVSGGVDGLESGFPLAHDQRFTVADVLTLRHAPERVVLAACDLGQRGTQAGDAGLGLAHAFLLAGARDVIAAVRPIDDRTTTRWVKTLYGALEEDAAAALHRTTLALQAEVPLGELAAFRAWVAD